MGDFGFLSKLLDKVQSHSTVIGKVWMTVLFLFRIMVLGAGVENVWGDERSSLVCNTQTPGCENICYDWKFPISHVRFWVLQIIFVSTPTLVYLGHAMHVIHKENKLREKLKKKELCGILKAPKYTNEKGKVKIKGILLRTYLVHLFFKIILELGFTVGQFYIYGTFMPYEFECNQSPCKFTVPCYMSRPTEKNIFIIFMSVMSCVSLLLNVVEVFYLLCNRAKFGGHSKLPQQFNSVGQPAGVPMSWQPRQDMVETMNQNKANMAFEEGRSL